MVELTVAANELEGEMIAGMLRANGIACDLRVTDIAGAVRTPYLGSGGPVAVWVDERDLEDARALLPQG